MYLNIKKTHNIKSITSHSCLQQHVNFSLWIKLTGLSSDGFWNNWIAMGINSFLSLAKNKAMGLQI